MTKEQELAIKRMNRTLKELDRVGIKICGMDSDLLYATDKAIKNTKNDGDYCPVANAAQMGDEDTGRFKAKCYQDSGGY